MNTTQNIQRIIAAGLLAASAGLAFSSCAGQSAAVADGMSAAQIAEQRSAYRDLAERRSELSRELGPARGELYRDQAERRVDVGAPVAGDVYRDQAERRLEVGAPVAGDDYRDQAERRLEVGGPTFGTEYRDLVERRLGPAGH